MQFVRHIGLRSRVVISNLSRAKRTLVNPSALLSNMALERPRDPSTLSNYHNFKTRHTAVDLRIDFEKKRISGTVILELESLNESEVDEIVLDTSALDVSDVKSSVGEVEWSVGKHLEPFGNPLVISLDRKLPKGQTVKLNTGAPHCSGSRPSKRQTRSTRTCPIYARSLFPCQDTPDVKSTFDFRITSPLQVVAGGVPDGVEPSENSNKVYKFRQTVPIPSYLFALASGDIVSATIGKMSSVWTSPDGLEAAKWEMEEDMDKYIECAEKTIFEYQWGEFNVLVLPPSFPYGGMENPNFTFATPTVVSGDRQNIDVIAHELSHSWSGNLVTNASWEHFWINEGWTVYLERRIQASRHGDLAFDFSAIIGWGQLEDSVNLFGHDHNFTKLIPDLKGINPDDCFSQVPYEKGFNFILHLERQVGRQKWDKFIPFYFEKFKYKSLDSYEFKAALLEFFTDDKEASKALVAVDWDKWFYEPGMPPEPEFDTTLADVCYVLAWKWIALSRGEDEGHFRPDPEDIYNFMATQSVVFLQTLQAASREEPLKPKIVKLLGDTYGYASSKNVEVSSRFFILGLQAKVDFLNDKIVDLLSTVGRMKFVRPLYRHLAKVNEKLAKDTFGKNKEFYHPICRALLQKDLYGSE